MLRPALALALLSTVALAACGREAEEPASSATAPALVVTATTRQVADFARAVGGSRVAVTAVIPANADPHDFEPRPSDARAVAESDVVVRSGGDLDTWLTGLVENAGGDAARVNLIDAVRTRAGGHHHEDEHEHAGEDDDHEDEVDPHWWQDPRNVERAAARLADAFSQADPDGADVYRERLAAYTARLRALDTRIARCVDSVPADRRKLVTNHDAFGYFADRYGIEVLGSIIPALSTSAQPSAGDLRRLVAAIKREQVTTIFPESALSRRLEQAVARDTGARVGAPLYADTLGPDRDATYVDALAHDANLIVASFGATCRVRG